MNDVIMLPSGTALRVLDGDSVLVGGEIFPAGTFMKEMAEARSEFERKVLSFVWIRLTLFAAAVGLAAAAYGQGTAATALSGACAAAAILRLPRIARGFREAARNAVAVQRIQTVLVGIADRVWSIRMRKW